MTRAPLVSIVVPVRNEGGTLHACLDSLFAQDYQPVEVIVIDDGSTDDTAAILASYGQRVQVLTTPGIGPSQGRNAGTARANGEYVAFTDGDCICDRGWIRELLRGFERASDVAGVGGDQRTPPWDAPYARRVGAFLQAFGFAGEYVKAGAGRHIVEVNHNPTCNVIYRKAVFDHVDGFVEWLWPGEDVEFDLRVRRAGFRLTYNPAAVVLHHRPDTPTQFRRMMFRYGEAQGILVRMYGPFRAIQWLPIMLAAGAAMAAGLAATAPPLLVGAGALGICGLALFLGRRTPDISTALACATMLGPAVWEWTRGYLKGFRVGPRQPRRATT